MRNVAPLVVDTCCMGPGRRVQMLRVVLRCNFVLFDCDRGSLAWRIAQGEFMDDAGPHVPHTMRMSDEDEWKEGRSLN